MFPFELSLSAPAMPASVLASRTGSGFRMRVFRIVKTVGVGAYAKCEGHNDNRCEDGAFLHAADRVTEIAPETIPRTAWTSVARRHGIENWPAVFGTDAGSEEVRVVELCGGPPVGIVRRNTAGGQVVVQILEVLRDFLDELVFGRGSQVQTGEAPADKIIPIRHVRSP